MRIILATLLFIIPICSFADTLTFQWDEVTTDVNGDPVVDLQGYKLYVSKESGVYTTPKATSTEPKAIITETAIGKYYAVVTAYNSAGESSHSNEISFEVKAKVPSAPQKLNFVQKIFAFIKSIFRIFA